jgi:tetratricopeptide (TPR) repeat protein
MAALVAAHRRTRGAASSSDVAGLSTYLLERERAAWHALGRRGLISTSPAVMAKAVTTAILTRALPAAGAVEVLAKAGVVDAAGAAPVLDDHAVCYPSTRMNSFLEPLYPDRLAEDFLALMLPGHQSPDFFVPASVALWADTLVDTLLTPADDDTAEPWLRESLVVLIETAQRWPHVAQKHLFPLLRKRPRLAIVAGGAAIIRLVEMPDADLETLGAIESQLPRRRHVDLDSASAAVSERIVALVMARTQDRVVWANLLTTLGRRLAYAGHQERALAVFGRAVRICAKLDGTDPDGIHAPEAAYAHDMCGLMLLELGRAAQAVEPSRNAVARYRTLVRRDRGHLPRLAGALSNLGLVLAHNDQIHDAIATGREALRIRRRLYRRDPESYAEELAISLSNLGGDLARLNRNTEALAMTQESLELRRRLAAQAPQTFSVEVAISLNNLVSIYLALHRTDEALRAASEAVEIRRGLASVNEAAFERPLASALQNLGALQVSLGQFDEAVTTFTHIVEIHRRLARADPVADADRQAGATAQLAALMLRAGRGEEARDLAAEALSLERHMTQVTPTKTRSHLVVASTYLVRALCAIGDRAEAETLARGVLDRGTSWAAAGEPAGHRVAQAFDLLRRALNRADFHDESLAAAEICVRMYRASDIRTDDDANILGFADALVGLGLCLRGAGRHPEGLRVVRDALAMIQRRGPEAIGALQVVAVAATVADSLLSYETGDFPRAVQASVEAVEASRGVVLPAQNAKLLVNVLELIAAWLRATDREAEATQARDRVDEVRARETVEDVDEIRLVRW